MNATLQSYTDQLPALLTSWSINIVGALLTLVVGFTVAGWLARLVTRTMRRATQLDPVFQPLPGKIVRVVIMVFTVIAVLNRFGVETASLIAVVGAAGLAIGLALQGTLSNVAAGVMLLAFHPFKIGDAVRIGSDVFIIDNIGFFACRAHLPDGPKVFLPNAQVWGETLVNLSETDGDRRRIDQTYGIAYSDDIDRALEVLQQTAAEDPRVLQDPAPLIKVQGLGASSVDILFRVWTARADWWETQLDLVKRNKQALEAAGVNFPFPQREVHIRQSPPAQG